jgi:DNA-binding transcriptional MerR regulator
VALNRRARDLGFSLGQIRSPLLLASNRSRSCADVDRLARFHLTRSSARIDDLTLLRDELRQTMGNCRDNTIAECRFLAAFTAESGRSQVPRQGAWGSGSV